MAQFGNCACVVDACHTHTLWDESDVANLVQLNSVFLLVTLSHKMTTTTTASNKETTRRSVQQVKFMLSLAVLGCDRLIMVVPTGQTHSFGTS